ncbi:MAG TPA: hypothetical protein VMR70_18045 [Flavisolibacter sp.]|nr:hypothetical protein [Flavisolibacter sp.]
MFASLCERTNSDIVGANAIRNGRTLHGTSKIATTFHDLNTATIPGRQTFVV